MTHRPAVLLAFALLLPSPLAAREGESRASVALTAVSAAAGMLAPGEREARRTLLVDPAARVMLVVACPVPFRAVIHLPDGTTLTGEEGDERRRMWALALEQAPGLALPGAGQGHNAIAIIEEPPPGEYSVELALDEPAPEAQPFTVTLLPESDVRIGLVLTATELRRDEPLVLAVLGFEGEAPLRRAAVYARLVRQEAEASIVGEPVALTDDGRGPDSAAGDGLFTGVILPREPGSYLVSIVASGRSRAGYPYERHAGAALTVTDEGSKGER